MDKILEVFRPSAVVLQCGADSLAGDRLGGFNLTIPGHAHCVQFMRDKNLPLILLGGGGYTVKNVARAWTYETACALGIEDTIDPKLPYNDYFEWFGPRYRLEVLQNNMDDMNERDATNNGGPRQDQLDIIRQKALQQLSELEPVPSVQIQDVPRESLGEHLGFDRKEEADELDISLARMSTF
jgi:histone deacetylase 1/2